jgi:phosphoribosylformylglycinamidine cyclo-ligase
LEPKTAQDAYAAAGVNIDAGNEAVRRIRAHVRSARTKGMLADIGSFGGLFRLPGGFQRPVLVASTDGVGTKLIVAAAMKCYDTVGQDLVNHCVNDILVQGARPLFFLDYFATGKLDPLVVEQVVKGLAQACRENGCALLGGETAEMPGLYQPGDFDLAGNIVGIVEQKQLIDGRRIRPGDVILGLPSTGLHTNGYSLARQIFFQKLKFTPQTFVPELSLSVGLELLKVHRSYAPAVLPLLQRVPVHGLAHITGGGFIDNIPRILPMGCRAVIQRGTWPILPIFQYLQRQGDLPENTLYRSFNMGIGLVLVLSGRQAKQAMELLHAWHEPVYVLGRIEKGRKEVKLI